MEHYTLFLFHSDRHNINLTVSLVNAHFTKIVIHPTSYILYVILFRLLLNCKSYKIMLSIILL